MFQRTIIVSMSFVLSSTVIATPVFAMGMSGDMMNNNAPVVTGHNDMGMASTQHKAMSKALHNAWKKHEAAMKNAKAAYQKELNVAKKIQEKAKSAADKIKAQAVFNKTKKVVEEKYKKAMKLAEDSWKAAQQADAKKMMK